MRRRRRWSPLRHLLFLFTPSGGAVLPWLLGGEGSRIGEEKRRRRIGEEERRRGLREKRRQGIGDERKLSVG